MRYPCVQQYSEEDCGAACIATILKYYKRNFSLTRIREAIGTGQLGTTLLGLRRGAETLGFNANAVRATSDLIDHLSEVPLPSIIHWKGYHWVVLYGQKRTKYIIADPAVGLRYLTREELTQGWRNGVMLLLIPDEIRFADQPENNDQGIRRFLPRIFPYKGILIEAFLINLLVGLLSLATPILIQMLTDDVLIRGDIQLLNVIILVVIIINLFSSLFGWIQSNLIANFSQRLELGFVLEFGRKILKLPISYYEARRSGEIVSRLRDIREINYIIYQVVISLPSQVFIALVSLILMIIYSWRLTLVAIIMATLMSSSTLIFLPTLQQKTRKVLVTSAENQGVLVENFKGALTLKSTNSFFQAWEEIQNRFGTLAKLTFKTVQIVIINNVFSGFFSQLGVIIILWYGGILVINQQLSIGQLIAFNSLNSNFTALIQTIINFVDEFARAKTATQRLTEVIDSTAEEDEETLKPWGTIADNADIVCQDLTFHHAGRIDLFKDFNLTISGGQATALIGQSGCGKSTLVKVIAGLYKVSSGNIRYGIYNQQDLSLDCLRQQIVLVPQETHFWSRSLWENFHLACPHATFEQIIRACQVTHADDFISDLPDKYQTVLGEFGANLSGGQRQRLALARAIVYNPPILLLDESTNALDPILENKVLDSLLHYRQGKTTIIISHRPRVILRADSIVFLEKGQLKLTGSPQELKQISGEHLPFLIP